jgi:tripartite-type tricarboxylate transporter receptor subunit TctC
MFAFKMIKTALAFALLAMPFSLAHAAWEPTKTVELIVPAGTGGGADQMARFVAKIVNDNKLMSQKIVVVNKSLGAGAEGFLSMKLSTGDPHKLIITLSNLFTTPLSTGVPFNWRDLTPVAMLSLDQFILWVNADTPYKTAGDYLAAVKKAGGSMKMGGTGKKQEDQIVTALIEQQSGVKFTYVPLSGGGGVAKAVASHLVDSSVNNPIEALDLWKQHKVRPLCVFTNKRLPYNEKLVDNISWGDIPTCASQGLNVNYEMLRGIFMSAGSDSDQVTFYVDLLKRVMATQEWKAFMEEGAFNPRVMVGNEYRDWVASEDARHTTLMKTAGFVAK